jgi:hypothetical protein
MAMAIRAWLFVLAAGCLLVAQGRASADGATKPDLKPLFEEVRKLVEKHYPKAKVTLTDQTISFEFNTRKYMIHEALLSGEWQDAFEEVGPQKGGIYGTVELRDGRYGGQAGLPWSYDKRYFTRLALAPYSEKLDRHLLTSLKYPREVPKGFVEEFVQLMDGFDKHLQAPRK